ncbi:MAG: beta-eliminating lyase-related protein [Candidatus Eremiobacteraeota bacterium]|nr:beta-eliminating lyase-related protein [Candidatus Eremiobacteraeota bacterium]
MGETLSRVSSEARDDEHPDRYGGGALLENFERETAQLLGKDAAVFMPSGTMAQQIALRIHAEQTGNDRVGLHPQSHLVMWEADAYERLSGLRGVPVGAPHRLNTLADLQALKELPGTLLVELPEREIGGMLRSWDELCEIVAWCAARDIRLHLDGARLWETQPFYADRSYSEIAGLFDTVYVSFYKILNGIAGAALAGPKALIDQARVWQHRHGGRLVQLYPYVLSARAGLRTFLPRMRAYRERAAQIAQILSEFPAMIVTPNPPHTNMMHIYIRGDESKLDAAMVEIARETGLALFGALAAAPVPGYCKFERSIGEGAFEISDDEIRLLFERLLKSA